MEKSCRQHLRTLFDLHLIPSIISHVFSLFPSTRRDNFSGGSVSVVLNFKAEDNTTSRHHFSNILKTSFS